ncbi:hypothetical protein BDP27DRAFT_1442696 [Rhodocollybia butyracea]|uniref:Uncharacterized protein n=1 Tax=Rhodocollybia butyracea TaxID=206335 RepID=A0A9P5Q224_9AGAR|nr:hypothetical protein BDP27DRAFT_1442696 [Rhodocollybia butyracea]
MAFTASSATLGPPPRQSRSPVSEYSDYPFTDGSQSVPPTPYSYSEFRNGSRAAYLGRGDDSVSKAGSRLTATDSTHLLPTTDRKKKRYIPVVLRLPIAIGVPLSLLLLAIALEIGIFLSEKNNGNCIHRLRLRGLRADEEVGFKVPTKNVITFAFVIAPGWVYRELDWHVRWYQPYVVMSRGNAKAEESVLLDYVSLGPVFSFINSVKFKHRVITWSTVTALATYLLQPLAGSMFQLQNLDAPNAVNITSSTAIEPSNFSSLSNLSPFVSSAGFVEASVFSSLPNPPFIINPGAGSAWTVAQFLFPGKDYLNGTLTFNTTAIQTTANCSGPTGAPTVLNTSNSAFNFTSTSANDCIVPVTVNDTNDSPTQYGVVEIPDTCSQLNITQRPVMFFHLTTNGTPEASTVFCSPSIRPSNVAVSANLNNNSVAQVSPSPSSSDVSNSTLGPFASTPLNGVIFGNQSNGVNLANALATQNGVSGAIFQLAQKSPGGIDAVFSEQNPFLDNTTYVYTLFLALVAQSVYFVPQPSYLNAEVSSLELKLTINPLPGHSLAIFLFFVGIVGIVLHIINRRQRRGLYLTNPPGTIAATIAMSSHSGFGELLMPDDDEETLERKLSDLRFSIDRRTGAIVASAFVPPTRDLKRMSKKAAREEAMESLLGEHKRPASEVGIGLELSDSSTQAAFEAAARHSYPPSY